VAGTYRGHGHALALGVDPEALMAELLGRETGVCAGRAGSMNVIDLAHGLIGCFGIVGGSIAAATGAALAFQRRGANDVAVAFFGEGTSNQAYFAECLNFARVLGLPAVFVCENNRYMEFTPIEDVTAGEIRARAETLGLWAETIDGMDVLAVRESVAEGVRLAHEERRPTLIEAFTYRYRGHSAADPEVYRERDEVEEWRQKDPIESFARRCIEAGVLGERELQEVRDKAEQTVLAAVEFAEASAEPPLDTLYENLYVLGGDEGWYAVDERSPEPHRGERESNMPDSARELAEAGAAYAVQGDGPRPNPATHGDAQEGVEPEVAEEVEEAAD
jgi:TPP-dependent pyruvate/acetoin dehydrogenase alpha subunit